MKGLFTLTALVLFSAAAAFAQHDAKSKAMLDKLSVKTKGYKTIEVKFSFQMINKEDNIDQTQSGVLKMKGDKYYAYYDPSGNWIGTAYVLTDYKSMPNGINTMITSKYAGYTITSVDRVMQKDRIAYEIQLKNGNSKAKILVDENGNIIKEKTVNK